MSKVVLTYRFTFPDSQERIFIWRWIATQPS